MEFMGFLRENGEVGVRNYVAVIPTVGCVNEAVEAIAGRVPGLKPLLHHQGCCMIPSDIEVVERTLIGLGSNPNVAAAIIIGLGCESVSIDRVADGIAREGKPVEALILQEAGGFSKVVAKGVEAARRCLEYAERFRRQAFDLSHLMIGIKCGSSDATSGIASNTAVGLVADKIIDAGGTVIFGEITELIGAEHILVKRAESQVVANQIIKAVNDLENRIRSLGIDVRGSNPTPGNIRGGLSTLEEKSLGAVVKIGRRPINGVLDYGERPRGKGLYMMISPGREMEFLTGPVAGGAQLLIFTTGKGAPQGYPIAPVIKVCGNPDTVKRLSEHIDVDVSGVISGNETLEETAEKIFEKLIKVASGEKTRAEILGYDKTMNIYVRGMIL
jgi:altronate dehydratase large subunit